MSSPPVSQYESASVTPDQDAALDDPRSLALSALDAAEWHARRGGRSEARVFVFAAAAVVYALLTVAKAAAAPRRKS